MKKLFLLFLLIFSTSAFAAERNSDVGLNTPTAWMLDPVTPNLWTVGAGKANGNGAIASQMLMQMNSGIKKGHKYHWQLDVNGRTTGILKVGIGLSMTGSVAFSPLSAPVTPIADSFTPSLGLTSAAASAHDDVRAAFRMLCSAGPHKHVDPVVYPGMEGRSHLHRFFGYTGVTADTTYAQQRSAKGMTTCGSTDPFHPLQKSLYWAPDMLDGLGNSIQPNIYNLYYKQWSQNNPECSTPGSTNFMPGAGGSCVNIPTALREIIGYDTSNGQGGPGITPIMAWQCWEWTSDPGHLTIHGPVTHLRDFFGSGSAPCPYDPDPTKNSMVGMFFAFPTCWDGSNLDVANHRSHMAWPSIPKPIGYSACDNTHPFVVPSIEIQVYWEVDPQLVAGKWHLSSDEMFAAAATDPGKTWHSDYMMAWSPTAIDKMFTYCFGNWLSCAGGALGDGTGLKGGDQTATTGQLGGGPDGHPANVLRYDPTFNAGMGPPIQGNGTFSGEITAAANGGFELIGVADENGVGFNGQVDNVSITDIASGHHGPATLHSQ